MASDQYYYVVDGEQLPLRRNDTARYVTPADGETPINVAARLAKSSRLGLDTRATGSNIVVRGDRDKLDEIPTYHDVESTRYVFIDSAGHEIILTNDVLVRFVEGSSEEERTALVDEVGAEVVETDGDLWTIRVADTAPDAPLVLANGLHDEDLVDYAEPNALQMATFHQVPAPQDSRFANQWHLDNTGQGGGTAGADVQALQAWAVSQGSPGIRICIHDSGVDIDHPDLAANMGAGYDFDNDDANASNDAGPHGTACAGIAAAALNNQGVVGIAPECRIVPLRAAGALTWSRWADTFEWAAARADVISCSWSISANNTLSTAIRAAAADGRNGRGIPIFFATGNDGTNSIDYPASLAETIAVGASTDGDVRATYSQFGTGLDFVAPSSGGMQRIETTDVEGRSGYNTQTSPDGDYCNAADATGFSGTSSATPLAAGIGALMLSTNAALTGAEVRQMMRDTAVKIDAANAGYDGNGLSTQYGFGRVDAAAAVTAAEDTRLPRVEGDLVVVWHDDRDKNDFYQIYARGLTGQGQGRFSEFTVNSEPSGQQLRPHIGIAPSGDFVVVWEDDKDRNGFYQIYARGFTADSNEVFRDLTVNSKASGQQLRPRVGVASDGDFVVVWQDDKDRNGLYQIYARGFDAGGSEKFHDMTVNSRGAGQQRRPDIAVAPNGDFVVVWEDDQDRNGFYQIYARGFNADGTEKFHDLTVNSKPSGQQLRPRVAIASGGDFVVVWEDDQDGNAVYQIYARGFEADGTEKFHDLTVNSVASGQQRRPDVAVAPNGDFVVVWQDDQDGNGFYQIYARGFEADGTEKFHDLTVNSEPNGQQLLPAVAIDSGGDFVVVWQDDQDDNGFYQIYARGFASDGKETFSDIVVNQEAAGQQLRPAIAVLRS